MLHKMLHNLRRGPQWGIVRCHHRPRSERYAPFIVVQCVGRSRIHTAEVGGSSPLAPTRCQEYNISPVEGALLVTDRSCRLVPHSNLCVAGDLQGRSRADEFESSGVRIAGSGGPGGPFCISDVAIIAQSTDPRCGALCHRMAVLPAILTMWLVAPRPRLARGP